MRRWLVSLAAAVVLASLTADAHTPGRLDTDHPFVLPDPTVSWAIFGEFLTGKEVFVVELNPKERVAVPVEVFVPHQSSLKKHRPAWALVGPGLPAPNAEELSALPRPLPPGFGAVVDLNQVEPRPVFYEFVIRRWYWSSGPMNVVIPQAACELWVWSPAGTTGKIGLGLGVEESGDYSIPLSDWGFYAY